MSTLHDVAKLSNVNISTVSRYLSGKLKVTEETETRIRIALEQTGYKPNLVARSLRSGASNLIGVIVPDIYQPGIAGIIYGIDQYLSSTSCFISLLMTKSQADKEIQALQQFRNMMIQRVIIIGHPLDKKIPNSLLSETIGHDSKIILISRNFVKSDLIEVCPNQKLGAEILTSHLIKNGYHSIGIIVSRCDHPDAIQKIHGYAQTLIMNGIEVKKEMIQEGYYEPKATAKATEMLLRQNVDAIICTSDEMAFYCIEYLHQKGISIPQQVAVAGYGGSKWYQSFNPKLTTIVVHVEELGYKAAEMLINFEKYKGLNNSLITLPVELRVGDST